jgi:hypothetical protein
MGELRDSFRPVEMDCPICGRVYSPLITECTHCNGSVKDQSDKDAERIKQLEDDLKSKGK